MSFKNLLKLVKKNKASDSKSAADTAVGYSDSLNIEAVQVVVDASKHAPAKADVHVKMVFNEAGEIVACEVEHLNVPSLAGVSGTSTLVERSPVLPGTPRLASASKNIPVDDVKLAAASRVLARSPAPTFATADFRVYQALGEGAQGTVSLVQHKKNGRLYALKAQKKSELKLHHYPFVFQEQAILKKLAGSKFITQLRGSFEDKEHFYLLTDFYPEGDLMKRIYKKGKIQGVNAIRWAAQLVLAVEEMHNRRVIHRDIKPANILITRDDDVVMSDFGFSRPFGLSPEERPWILRDEWVHGVWAQGVDTALAEDITCRDCGTTGYMAPEVLRREQYSYSADIYSLGVVIYEMLQARLPFGIDRRNRDPKVVYEQMMTQPLEVDGDIDLSTHHLLYMMLDKDPSRRPSLEKIKAHPWFASIDWKALARRLPPRPLRPNVGFQPCESSQMIIFGTPYAAGEAPHWWYQWTEPDFPMEISTDKPKKSARKPSKSIKSPVRNTKVVPPAVAAVFASPVSSRSTTEYASQASSVLVVRNPDSASRLESVPRLAAPTSPSFNSESASSLYSVDFSEHSQYSRSDSQCSASEYSSIALSAAPSFASSTASTKVAFPPRASSPREHEPTEKSLQLPSFLRRAWWSLRGVRIVSRRAEGDARLDLLA